MKNTQEVWRDIRKGYQVSNRGQVRSLDRYIECKNGSKRFVKGKILKPHKIKNGYEKIEICDGGKGKFESVHRLVWEAFNGEIPKGMQINHINEDKADNRLENLNLMTCKENSNWGTRNKRIGKANSIVQRNNPKFSKPIIQKSLQGEVIKIWPSAKEIQRQLGYAHPNISTCCKGGYYRKGKWINITQVYGYIWEYYTD